MLDPTLLVDYFHLNLRILESQTNGLSTEDSLRQLPFRGNCLNWVLGHIMVNRARVLKLLGQKQVWDKEKRKPYLSGSEPITQDGRGIQPLKEILRDLALSQVRIQQGLESVSFEKLEMQIQTGNSTTSLGHELWGLYFHETYHTGQTELLRQLTGTDDQIF